MFNFIKQLFGFGSTQERETIKEILTPPAKAEVATATYIPPAKPVNKVRAVSVSGAEAIKAAVAQKPANKKRRPYRGNKNAGGTVAKVNGSLAKVGVSPSSITEGKTKGGNGSVKPAQVAKAKPAQPKPAKKK